MDFIFATEKPIQFESGIVYLFEDTWNDFGYHTSYNVCYAETQQELRDLGYVKIGEVGMNNNHMATKLPPKFRRLDSSKYFSLGVDDSYYKHMNDLSEEKGYEILKSLNDLVLNSGIFQKVREEDVVHKSLFRDINKDDYGIRLNQFYNMLRPPVNLKTMRMLYGSTGWQEIDEGLVEMQRLLNGEGTYLRYNAVATIGREILKKIATVIYDDEIHRDKEKNTEAPNDDQFINKLLYFIDYTGFEKSINENLKTHIRHTIILVQGYVHKQDADHFECFILVNTVISLVFNLSIIYHKEKYNDVGQYKIS